MNRSKKIFSLRNPKKALSGDLAVCRLSITTIIRSYTFWVIAILLGSLSVAVPFAIVGEGTPVEIMHVCISYTLTICSTIIFVSTIWFGCFIMTTDIESYSLHMLVVKPLHKYRIWFGRFSGVVIVHFLLLILVTTVIYVTVNFIPYKYSFSPESILTIKERIFTGRKNIISDLSGVEKEFKKEYHSMVTKDSNSESKFTEKDIAYLKKRMVYNILAREGEVKPNSSRTFVFHLQKSKYSGNGSLSFTPYIGSPDILAMQHRPNIEGKWEEQVNNGSVLPLSKDPMRFLSNDEYVINVPLKNLIPGMNTIKLTYINLDKDRSVFFRLTESPLLQIKRVNFLDNYLRYIFIATLGIIFLSAFGCALGGLLSFPTAVFVIVSYLIFGSLGNFILSSAEPISKYADIQLATENSFSENFLKIATPIQKFELSEYIASGRFIGDDYCVSLIMRYFLIQFLFVLFAGVYLFSKRELGMVIKK